MKLLNQSLKYLSISILAIVSIWSIVFYVNMLSEIKSSIDEGLENYKRLIIQNSKTDSTILTKDYFDESFFFIREIDKEQALLIRDRYIDTILYMQDADDENPEAEPVRMLSSSFEINNKYYELKVANSMVEEDDLIDELLWDVVWLYIILISSIVVINNVVLKKLWKPFYDFLHQLKDYRLGSTEKLPETSSKTKEFKDLQTAVNTLLGHSITAFESQKEFIGNASHELQTPLAIVINKLELLLEQEDLGEGNANRIIEVFQIINRLIRLNKSLLLLSKIDNKQFFNNEQVSLSSIVKRTIKELEEVNTSKNLKINLQETEELIVNIDSTLAHIIISNLLKNAIFHNVTNGSVEIEISKDRLKVFNSGKQALDQDKLFSRFQKLNTETSGTGLGLALVKAIVDLYNYPVSYHFNGDMHCFEIHFCGA